MNPKVKRQIAWAGPIGLMVVVVAAALAVVSAPQANAVDSTFDSVADSFVNSVQPDANNGTSTEMRMRNAIKKMYLRFNVDLPDGAGITSALLRIHATSANTCTAGADAFRAGNDTWGETNITWNNQPGTVGNLLGNDPSWANGTRTDIPVTTAVTGDGLVSFVVQMPATCNVSSDSFFQSREAANDPQLVVTYNPAPPPECSDGIDNDSDGVADYPLDSSCSSPTDNDETVPEQCSDTVDNDGDGRTDYPADPGCEGTTDNTESPDPPPPGCVGNQVSTVAQLREAEQSGNAGETFCIAAGTYALANDPLNVANNVTLKGAAVAEGLNGEIDAPSKITTTSTAGAIVVGSSVTVENLDVSGATGTKETTGKDSGRGLNGSGGGVVTVRFSRFHGNSNTGIGGIGDGSLIENVELDNNGSSSYLGCCAGGIKAANDYTIRDSYVHDNVGNGVWVDVSGSFVVLDNLIVRNTFSGVRYECNSACSETATISNNTVQDNNTSHKDGDAGGIVVNSAPDGNIGFNILGGNFSAGIEVRGGRGPVTGNNVHDNDLNGDVLKGCNLSGVTCTNNTP